MKAAEEMLRNIMENVAEDNLISMQAKQWLALRDIKQLVPGDWQREEVELPYLFC